MHHAGAPRFLLIVGAVYVALGAALVPRTSPYFRPWERVLDVEGDGFVPNVQVAMPSVGDLAHNTWQRRRQVAREQTFTTDGAGLRNPPFATLPRIVVVGDSFVAGAGLDDDETISAALARELGEDVYNYGCPDDHGPPSFMTDERFRAEPPRAVVWMVAGRSLKDPPRLQPRPSSRNVLGRLRSQLRAIKRSLPQGLHPTNSSWLVHAARFGFNGLRDRVMGGWVEPYREIRFGGATVLTLSPTDQRRHSAGAEALASRLAGSLVAWRDALAARGTRLIVAPVPECATTFPELYHERDLGEGAPLFEACLSAMQTRGLEAIDLLPVLRGDGTTYPYLRDDTHWSAAGVARVGSAVATVLGRTEPR